MLKKKLLSLAALLGFISVFAGNLKKVYNPGTKLFFCYVNHYLRG
jgi:hypothetical protein